MSVASVIDLRSDTLTQPSAGMRAAMTSASVGDDVYDEDPTVHELEARVAALLGHEAGLFTATGSLANQLGVALHVGPGEEVLCDARAHIARAEMGAHGALHGVTMRTWVTNDGVADAAQITNLLEPDAGPYLVSTRCVALENTHNFGGGTIQPLPGLQRVTRICHEAPPTQIERGHAIEHASNGAQGGAVGQLAGGLVGIPHHAQHLAAAQRHAHQRAGRKRALTGVAQQVAHAAVRRGVQGHMDDGGMNRQGLQPLVDVVRGCGG